MLPFLQKKNVAGLIISHRKPDSGIQESHTEGDEDHALEAAAEDLIRAFHAKDGKHAALALRAAFQILEAEEDQEEPSTEEMSE